MRKLSGIKLPHNKNTAETAPVTMGDVKTAYYPMHQHIGSPAQPCVKAGDSVYVGTMVGKASGFVSAPIYSGISGKVKKVEEVVQSNGTFSSTVIVESDGLMTPDPEIAPPVITDTESFVSAVVNSGMVGLGGAGFPTAVKLSLKDKSKLQHIIINGAECEPYITSDTRTMIDRAEDICEGIELLRKYLGCESFIIGIEKNKPKCINNMEKTAGKLSGVRIHALPSVYPQGGEKVLIYHTTGKVVGEGMLPVDVGVVMINCTTLAELAKYVRSGMPLVEKCVTVDGSAVKEPKNLIVPVGTPAKDVFEFCGGFKEEPAKIVYGGPMMGISLSDIEAPVLKQTNALLAFGEKESRPLKVSNCIRCGRCTNTCPFGLAPVAMVTAYEKGDGAALASLHANLCMECGCCSYVCPANRPLVQQNKLAKAFLADWKKKNKEENK